MKKKDRRIPNRLKLHRKIMQYKQRDVAHMLGHRNTVMLSSWERGLTTPNLRNLLKLSILYRTYPNELYWELYEKLCEEMKKEFK
jgi:DNA-binding XRE family transcriptional regulator